MREYFTYGSVRGAVGNDGPYRDPHFCSIFVGTIPEHLAPLLQRLGVRGEGWLEVVTNFGRWFHRVIGRVEDLRQQAARSNGSYFHGLRYCGRIFG